MLTYKLKFIIANYILTLCVFSSNGNNIIFTNVNNEIQLTWTSGVNQTFSLYTSTNLVNGHNKTNTLQATPPINSWWTEIDQKHEYFQLTLNEVTNIPPTPATTTNIIHNGDFSDNTNNWNIGFGGSAMGNATVTNNEILFDINNAGNAQYNIFLRYPNLNLINGTNYTLSFDARANTARPIYTFIRNEIGESPSVKFWRPSNNSDQINISPIMTTYNYNFSMNDNSYSNAVLHFGFGGNSADTYIDNISLTYNLSGGMDGDMRIIAHDQNRRLGRGNNFMAAKAISGHGRLEDYQLLNQYHFSHCRIGYKMDEKADPNFPYNIPEYDMNNLKDMINWCNQMGLIAIVDPIHNWMADDSLDTFDQSTDLDKLSNIWVQVATELADYSKENVFFEIANEPRYYHNAQEIISTGLSAIRSVSNNLDRMVIICGDAFSTRQALIDEFNNNTIPTDDPFLIGTFHYYDPFDFTKQGDIAGGRIPGTSWGTESEFQTVEDHFDAVINANNSWANRNNTQPLPIYLGEFGVDNEADNHHMDRKKWLSWIRIQAEKRNFSWAHWNMYQNTDSSKGMGPWGWNYYQTQWPNSMYTRSFDEDPVEALIGRYEFENGTKGGNVQYTSIYPGYSGNGYASFPSEVGWGVFAQINSIYIPKDDTYKIKIHYSSEEERALRIVSRNNEGAQTGMITEQIFPSTGGNSSWSTLEINIPFHAGETNDLRIIALSNQGVNLDWIHITQ